MRSTHKLQCTMTNLINQLHRPKNLPFTWNLTHKPVSLRQYSFSQWYLCNACCGIYSYLCFSYKCGSYIDLFLRRILMLIRSFLAILSNSLIENVFSNNLKQKFQHTTATALKLVVMSDTYIFISPPITSPLISI